MVVGANQRLITITLLVIGIINIILKRSRLKLSSKLGSFAVFINYNNEISINKIMIFLRKIICNLKRSSFESSTGEKDISLSIELSSYKS